MKMNEITDRLNGSIRTRCNFTEEQVTDLIWTLGSDPDLRGAFEVAVCKASDDFAREMAATHPE